MLARSVEHHLYMCYYTHLSSGFWWIFCVAFKAAFLLLREAGVGYDWNFGMLRKRCREWACTTNTSVVIREFQYRQTVINEKKRKVPMMTE
jgi:hypothetical protein